MSDSLVFYISGHGFGHASRAIEVLRALLARCPAARAIVRTAIPRRLFQAVSGDRIRVEPFEADTGIVQLDSLRLDEAASIARADAFYRTLPARAAEEARYLTGAGAALVAGDIPPLAFAAAAAAGLPSIAMGNFTWDWIYEDYPGVDAAPRLLPAIRGAYAGASLALRLPLSGGFESTPLVRDVPLIARHAVRSRDEVCGAFGLPPGVPIVLMSFGGHGLDGFNPASIAHLEGYTVIAAADLSFSRGPAGPDARRGVVPIDESAIAAAGFRYQDLVAAADVVVTKPGYGIISECAANQTAILYTSRGRFREYDVLVREMPRFVRAAFIGQDDLFAGRWEKHLEALLASPAPPKPDTTGADVVAEILARALNTGRLD
ncbi:MAG: hypothetical protein FJW23_05385 [Acidimicrobiia bacterium]|nr:hypothetical protein [Acidimicrobiia bacterium]